jgi:uncharacterized protein (TIGR02996 family)
MTDHENHERSAFFALIRADPTNNDTRLVFADWCEEHGDMELAGMLRGGSEAWLRAFVAKFRRHLEEQAGNQGLADIHKWGQPPTYESVMKEATDFLERKSEGLVVNFHTTQWMYDDFPEFWKHFEVLTGRALPADLDSEGLIYCIC